jgi:outer membrane protein assembly factor BamB
MALINYKYLNYYILFNGEVYVTRKIALLITGILCSFLVITPAHAAMGDVVLSFNAVAHNSTGLTWVDGYLWNIGHGHNVPAELHKLDPSDGSEILKIILPIEHVMGLTWDGDTFWAVSHEDSVIYQLNATTGSIIHSFPSPNPGTVETGCNGMAWDGQYLWYTDSDLDRIYQLDPVDGAEIISFPSPGSRPEGLAWDGLYLWHFDLTAKLVYQLDSTDGSVLVSFTAPGTGQGDLAWDGNYLWMSRNADDTIYKIEIVHPQAPVAEAGNVQPVFSLMVQPRTIQMAL